MSTFARLLTVFLVVFLLGGCATQKKKATVPMPDLNIGVASFTQPASIAELLAGIMYSEQAPIDLAVLAELDLTLNQTLHESSDRIYAPNMDVADCQKKLNFNDSKTALEYWVNVGRCAKLDLLLVPQITYFRDREGSAMGVTKPTAVIFNLYLIDVRTGNLINRFHFEEEQQSLSNNLLNIKEFVSRSGKWLTGLELAREGFIKGKKDLGL